MHEGFSMVTVRVTVVEESRMGRFGIKRDCTMGTVAQPNPEKSLCVHRTQYGLSVSVLVKIRLAGRKGHDRPGKHKPPKDHGVGLAWFAGTEGGVFLRVQTLSPYTTHLGGTAGERVVAELWHATRAPAACHGSVCDGKECQQ